MSFYRLLCLFCCALLAPLAYAARPMITDDARIVDDKSCQVESWSKNNRDSREFWALPSCNFTGNLELAFGGATTQADGETRLTDKVFQAKTLFRTLQTNDWAWGLAVGNVSHPDVNRKVLGDLYAYIPASFSFLEDAVLVHTNIGWQREKEDRRQTMTWGIGSELELTPSTWLIAETYGQNQGRPFYQMGVRHWIVHNRVQIDATYGNRSDGSTSWFSIGLRLLSPAFLP